MQECEMNKRDESWKLYEVSSCLAFSVQHNSNQQQYCRALKWKANADLPPQVFFYQNTSTLLLHMPIILLFYSFECRSTEPSLGFLSFCLFNQSIYWATNKAFNQDVTTLWWQSVNLQKKRNDDWNKKKIKKDSKKEVNKARKPKKVSKTLGISFIPSHVECVRLCLWMNKLRIIQTCK